LVAERVDEHAGREVVMSTRVSSFKRYSQDHFQPQDDVDPNAQRKLRGQLEQIDYTAFASNREVINALLGSADAAKFQRLAVAAAHARASWVKAALSMTETSATLDPAQIAKLHDLRASYEELTEVYEGFRRMVERGYLNYRTPHPG
jgi:hypothetical protein